MSELIKSNKKIYRNIHLKYKDVTKKRVSSVLSASDLGNIKLSNLIGIDVCCGALGLGAINLINLGIREVHLFDLSHKNVLSSKKNILKNFKNKKIIIKTFSGNLEKFLFQKNFYDVILFQGALHHIEKDTLALKNIYKGAKKNCVFILTVQGKGGLITDTVFKVFNKSYFENKKVKLFFDKIFSDKKNLKKYINILKKNTNPDGKMLLDLILKLADSDFLQTLEDRIKSKKYYQYSFKEINQKLLNVGFKQIKKIKKMSKYKYTNLRQIFNSVYIKKNTFLSHVLYGDHSSHINIRCTK